MHLIRKRENRSGTIAAASEAERSGALIEFCACQCLHTGGYVMWISKTGAVKIALAS